MQKTVTESRVPASMAQLTTGGKVAAVVPRSLEECFRLAQYVIASGWAPREVKTPEAAMVVILHGLEVGVPPMAALQGIANINGRPCIWGDLALALVRASGSCEWVKETIDGAGDARKAWCEVKRKGEPEPVKRGFSVADAKNAGLWGKRGQGGQPTPWVTYPERMLQMRARAWALRDGFADVLKGLHIREEIEDISPMRDVTPPPPPPPPPPARNVVEEPEKMAESREAVSENGGKQGGTDVVESYPEMPAILRRKPAEDAEVIEGPHGITPEQLTAYLDEMGVKGPDG